MSIYSKADVVREFLGRGVARILVDPRVPNVSVPEGPSGEQCQWRRPIHPGMHRAFVDGAWVRWWLANASHS